VVFTIEPRVGAAAPILHVTVTNPNPVAVPLTRFADSVCFAAHYLGVRVSRSGQAKTARACAIRDWPGVEEALAPGTSETIDLPLTALFGTLASGVHEIEVDWDPSGLERMRPGTGVLATRTSLNVSSFAIAKPLATFKIKLGKTMSLPRGARLTFSAHGHKRVMAGGPSSPLIVHGTFSAKGVPSAEFSVSVHADDSRLFSIGDHLFELVAHEYDSWMQLRYYGKLVLE
jgi:hypothetical protein